MELSRHNLLASLRELHAQRRRLLARLTQEHDLAVGTVSVVRRKCGNPRCHCARGPGHPQTLFLFKADSGQRRCKLVRRDDEARMSRAGERYREFRESLMRLRAINDREEEILMALRDLRAVRYE